MSNRTALLIVFGFLAFIVLWGMYIGPWLGEVGR